MTDTPTVQQVAMKGVITDASGKVLLLREADGYADGSNPGRWQLPGGRIQLGEAPYDGLRREIREETNLEVAVGTPIFMSQWTPVIQGTPTQIIGIFVACRRAGGEVKLSTEHSRFAWVSPADFNRYDIMELDALAAWQKAVGT